MKLSALIINEIKKNIHPSAKDKKKYKEFVDRYFPGGKAYGARNPVVRSIAKKYLKDLKDQNTLLKIAEELWNDGFMESRIIASIFLSKIKDEETIFKTIKKWLHTLDNWANCDILMSETKNFWLKDIKRTVSFSKDLIKSSNTWLRRFGLIILIFPVRNKLLKKEEVIKIAEQLKNDKEKYVKKGYIWLLDQIKKGP